MILKQIAQMIVENTTEIIGYPISITDEKGYIIGATDPNRLGSFHQASLDVLKKKQIVCYEMTEIKTLKNVLPGVATPIMFNHEAIGVLGIIGNPADVKKYAQIVKSHVEMMCQEFFKQEVNVLESQKIDTLIHHLINSQNTEDHNRIIRYGKILGYDLNVKRACLLIDIDMLSLNLSNQQADQPDELALQRLQKDLIDNLKYYFIDNKQDIISLLTLDQFIIFKTINSSETADMFLKKIKHKLQRLNQYLEVTYHSNAAISIGNVKSGVDGIRESYLDALKALSAGTKTDIYPRIYHYNDWNIALELLSKGLAPYIKDRLAENYHDFIYHDNFDTLSSTFMTYCKCNMNLSETARSLFLHRNSLVYRLEKIRDLTSLNLANFEHCLLLYFAIKIHSEGINTQSLDSHRKIK
ncbi:CdaR family transcriptional regulator [Peribacillus asahii]|uniref:CdaR family transcriptional regulator n=1 Tax=Peribacillus asahii TaxID=228899 RepID=UPI0038244B6E